MSQENVQVVRSMWEAFLQGDAEHALAAFHPEVEWDGRNLPDGRVAHGIAEVVDHVGKWAQQWQNWTVDLERFVDADDGKVLLIMREHGLSASGLEMNERHAELYTVRDGQIVARVGFSDPAEALEAVGLSE
jgi:ketosteroid isomerase-like protein